MNGIISVPDDIIPERISVYAIVNIFLLKRCTGVAK